MSDTNFHCKRCGASWAAPELSTEQRREVVASLRQGNTVASIKLLDPAGYDLRAAKATAFHITKASGICHRCSKALGRPGEQTVCGRCGSLNLDW